MLSGAVVLQCDMISINGSVSYSSTVVIKMFAPVGTINVRYPKTNDGIYPKILSHFFLHYKANYHMNFTHSIYITLVYDEISVTGKRFLRKDYRYCRIYLYFGMHLKTSKKIKTNLFLTVHINRRNGLS